MKVGIITYHSTENCGAMLQSYALLNVLNSLGINGKIIDYKCQAVDDCYKVKKIWELRSLKEAVKWLIALTSDKKAKRKFEEFRDENLVLTESYDKNNIVDANNSFDAFITGSDQVWNFALNGDDENYILKFASTDKIKISYAASVGNSENVNKYCDIFTDNLKSFDGISLRESDASEEINAFGFSSCVMMDPTLLMDKNDYHTLEEAQVKGKYIFVYTVADTPNIEKKAKELSRKTKLPIIWAHMSYKSYKGVKNIKKPSCGEFLSLIKNAEYVLTSSFHGMAFSMIYEKEFFYDLSVNENNYNSRLITLSDIFDVASREIQPEKDISEYEKLDYDKIRKIKIQKKEEALDFIKKSLGI